MEHMYHFTIDCIKNVQIVNIQIVETGGADGNFLT